MKTFSAKKPEQSELRGKLLLLRYTTDQVNLFNGSIPAFEPEEIRNEQDDINYAYEEVKLNETDSRDTIIAALINDRYSNDAQIAMLANAGDGNPLHEEEIAEFQQFRQFVKELSKIFFNEKI